MTYLEEEKKLFKNYLDTYCFNHWKKENKDLDFDCSLELIVSPVCNTKCSYCYYKNFGDKLYPFEIAKEQNILDNLEKFLKFLRKNDYRPRRIDIFSGEPLNLPYFDKILELLDNYLLEEASLMIPTNGTFCFSEEKLQHAQNVLDRYNKRKDSKLRISYSLSVDGKYLDNDTRAMRNGQQYTDEFYDKLFTFAHKNYTGFHPMIGAKGIEKWVDNYQWYLDNVCKYWNISENEAIDWIYLLEVRNPDWSREELLEFQKFLKFLVKKTFKASNSNKQDYFEDYFKGGHPKMNLFSSFSGTNGRGLGCSIQQALVVRLGDLSLVPCHRTAYPSYKAGYFILDNDGNWVDFKLENHQTVMFAQTFNFRETTKCSDCIISSLCNGPCLGCNFEVNHDMFAEVETVCNLEKAKTIALVDAFEEIGVLDLLIDYLLQTNPKKECNKKASQIFNLKKYILEDKK